ncbi:MAG: hypothetical protein ACP5PQ_06310 [Thermoproteota archaeon]
MPSINMLSARANVVRIEVVHHVNLRVVGLYPNVMVVPCVPEMEQNIPWRCRNNDKA